MSEWFRRAFGERYLRLYAHRDLEEARQALDTLFPGHALAGRRVLDLACGAGRYLRLLHERGADAVGIDLSPELLAEALRVGTGAPLVRADMRRLPFADGSFDLTLSMFTSFGYFESRAAHEDLAVEIGRVTRSIVVVDLPDPESLARDLVPESERRLEDRRVVERRELLDSPRRVVKRIGILEAGGTAVEEQYEERVMLFDHDEVGEIFGQAGFAVVDTLGDYSGAPWIAGEQAHDPAPAAEEAPVSIRLEALAPGVAPAPAAPWQELYASGADFGCAAPRLRDLQAVKLRSGPLFADPAFLHGLRDRHRALGADEVSLAAIEELGSGAACVITGQQPHLLTGPLYTAWKIGATIALARRLERLHGRRVVPVYWCGSDDSDFDEISSAWLYDRKRGPWRLQIPAGEWKPGMSVGEVRAEALEPLEEAALLGLAGPGVEGLHRAKASIGDGALADRAAAWALRLFAGTGLVVVDAADDRLVGAARPLLERYVPLRAEVAAGVAARAGQRMREGFARALDADATTSGIFARRDSRRIKLTAQELESGSAMRWTWTPSVLLRPVVQDALLAPVAAVLGPGELAYHAEIAPVYAVLGVDAARPVQRPHLTLLGEGWGWPGDDASRSRLLGGGSAAIHELAHLGLPASLREAFGDFSSRLRGALDALEQSVGHAFGPRAAARLEREAQRLERAEAERGGQDLGRRAEWLARGRVPQERLYSAWHLWAWFEDPQREVFDPVGEAWLDAVDTGGPAQWALFTEVLR